MGWNAPRTWVADEIVSASTLNTHLRDNLSYLKSPAFAMTGVVTATILSASATTFTAIGQTVFNLTIAPQGDAVMVGGLINVTTSGLFFDIGYSASGGSWWSAVGSAADAPSGLGQIDAATRQRISLNHWVTGLSSASSYTFFPLWRSHFATSAMQLYNSGVKNVFWVREVS